LSGRSEPPVPLRLWRGVLVLLVAAICVLAFMPVPPQTLSSGWDKLNHAFAFATLAVTAGHGFPGRRRIAGIAVALVAFGGFIEVVQAFVPGRSSEWADLLADGVGIAVGLAVLEAVQRLRGSAAPR